VAVSSDLSPNSYIAKLKSLPADDTEEVRRLGMGRLLSDISDKMYAKVSQRSENKLKLLVHSTHDTSLAGICKTLEVFDEK
jgi:acid phosphatase